ncbi:uncharacterized protein EAF01_006389 [Botrytis porri]|uniref:XPG-I domain-containing protein n=1 Tax=Botrytis porri TaxID=87229 RepID=A0A4Z1KVZ5_9HELO|nr:uncharacterized protein EAF01_006389 [Botrytis porri]KAF7903340.1 hypothetical protein EAF01_006389 [Botrytis porri]TGO88681.1 hypothetical protein BPOR_0148g00140 [Botrytis porri]
MGIPALWQLFDGADIGEKISTAAFAAQHFERERRPLRIAVDVSIWKFKCYPVKKEVEIRKEKPQSHLNERNIFYKILKLLKLNIQLIFVADGSNRPREKYGAQSPRNKYLSHDDELLKNTVTLLGVKWHEAPGEAEAECAALQSRGVVDAVWTDDADAFMFGCTCLIRFCYVKPKERKTGKNQDRVNNLEEKKRHIDLDNIMVYRADKIQVEFPGLTREGLVLFAVLQGGDYSKNGKSLANCGKELALKIANPLEGFGKELCDASDADFPAWRNRLRGYLPRIDSRVHVPDKFPDPHIVGLYNKPLVSSERILSDIGKFWDPSFDEMELQRFILAIFNFGVAEYTKHIIPILLIRSLASTQPGQEAINNCYKLNITTKKKSALQKNVEVLLSAVTSMDVQALRHELKNQGRSKKIAPVTEMAECEGLLTCILEHGTKQALPPFPATSERDRSMVSPETIFRGKKRAGSPIALTKTFSSAHEDPPSKRAKTTPDHLSRPIPVAKASIESTPTQSKVSNQARNIFSYTKENPSPKPPEWDRSPKLPKLGVTKKSPKTIIDLTLDDSSDEENQTPTTHARNHTITPISSQKSQQDTIRKARLEHYGSDVSKPAYIPAVQTSIHSATPNARKVFKVLPLAKKPLPPGIKDDDLDGFFSG